MYQLLCVLKHELYNKVSFFVFIYDIFYSGVSKIINHGIVKIKVEMDTRGEDDMKFNWNQKMSQYGASC